MRSIAHPKLVGVLGHEVAEDFRAVKELAVQLLLRFDGRNRVGELKPHVALVIFLNEQFLQDPKLLSLLAHFLAQVLEKGRSSSLHLEEVGHEQVWC